MSLQPRRMLSLWHAGVAAGCAAPEFVPRFDPPIAPASLAELPPLPSGATLSLQQRALLGSGSVGLGGRRWPAAATLCRYLLEHRAELVHQRRVLEIGCGGGAVGIYAAALGAASVLLTDGGGEALLELASANVRRNEEVLAMIGDAHRVRVEPYVWGASTDRPLGRYDLVLGSDVTYARGSHEALCESVGLFLSAAPDVDVDLPDPELATRVIIAHEHRRLAIDGRGETADDDAQLAHFTEVASAHGIRVTPLCTERQAKAGLRDVSILELASTGE